MSVRFANSEISIKQSYVHPKYLVSIFMDSLRKQFVNESEVCHIECKPRRKLCFQFSQMLDKPGDIALLQLEKDAPENVGMACMPHNDQRMPSLTSCSIVSASLCSQKGEKY